jgi:SAM-dependent methyltransferase
VGLCCVTTTAPAAETRAAYDAVAPAYDLLTAGYAHDRWLAALEELALGHGLRGQRLLDVACGTGKSFLPLLARGYEVTACDISEGMLALARIKAPRARLHRVDMRELPVLGRFDLITCLDDPLNYLLHERELEAALRGIARNLRPDGIALWDLNTLAQYRGQFAHDQILADDGMFVGWRGAETNAEAAPGAIVEVVVDVFARTARPDHWRRTASVHRQRHWPRETLERVSRRAGLELLDVRGQHPGAVIDEELDELVHIKGIYVARPLRGGTTMIGGL